MICVGSWQVAAVVWAGVVVFCSAAAAAAGAGGGGAAAASLNSAECTNATAARIYYICIWAASGGHRSVWALTCQIAAENVDVS